MEVQQGTPVLFPAARILLLWWIIEVFPVSLVISIEFETLHPDIPGYSVANVSSASCVPFLLVRVNTSCRQSQWHGWYITAHFLSQSWIAALLTFHFAKTATINLPVTGREAVPPVGTGDGCSYMSEAAVWQQLNAPHTLHLSWYAFC